MILEAIKRYKQNTNDTLRFRVADDNSSIIMYKGGRELVFTKSCEYRAPLKLSEKTDPDWTKFIRILNATFYEKQGMYSAYLERVSELCEDDDIYVNMCANLIVKKVPLAYSINNEDIEYISTTRMMIKGYQIGLNDKPRIFRNTDAIVLCDIVNHYVSNSPQYLQYTERVLEGLVEFRDDLTALNQILLDEINEVEPPLILNGEMNECPVCYENTNKKTRCNHPLCDNCFNQLPGQKKCPLCRGLL
jgi:hypothetical protein